MLNHAIWIAYFIVLLLTVTSSLLILRFIRKRVHWRVLTEHHEVAGYVFNAVGIMYAVLMAFVIYVTWTQYNVAAAYVEQEAGALQNLFLLVEDLPDPERTQLWNQLREYTKTEIEGQWKAISHLEKYEETPKILNELYQKFLRLSSVKTINAAVYKEMLTQIKIIKENSEAVITSNQIQVPKILWLTIILICTAFIGCVYFFGIENLFVQSCLTAILTTIVTTMLFLVVVLDSPFSGNTKISLNAFVKIYEKTSNSAFLRNKNEPSDKSNNTNKTIPGSISS